MNFKIDVKDQRTYGPMDLSTDQQTNQHGIIQILGFLTKCNFTWFALKSSGPTDQLVNLK